VKITTKMAKINPNISNALILKLFEVKIKKKDETSAAGITQKFVN